MDRLGVTIADELARANTRLRKENERLRARIQQLEGGRRYDTPEQAAEARRRRWRESKRELRQIEREVAA